MDFLRLPNETILKILSFLRISDIANTALVSHQFCNRAQLPLYSHLVLRRPSDPYSASPLFLLLRTLIYSSPGRTSQTRSLHVNNDPFDDYSIRYGADLVKLLKLLPRLEFLQLRPLFDIYGTDIDPFFNCLGVPCPAMLPVGLRNITEFRVTTGYPGRGFSVELMALPNLRTLAACVNDMNHGDSLFSGTPGTSGISQFELVDSEVAPEMLGRILKIPRSLASFTYTVPGEVYFNTGILAPALLPLQESLARLVIDLTTFRPEGDGNPGSDGGTIGALRHWRRLGSLDCTLRSLFGRGPPSLGPTSLQDLLPASLNSLCIREDNYWNAEHVVDRLVSLLPSDPLNGGPRMLRTVAVGTVPTVYRARLAEACNTAGVVLVE